MKKFLITLFLIMVAVSMMAQAPQKMNFQAVVRNANNSLVANQNVSARISILQGSATGTAVYSETHTVQTNANGLLTLEIGGGNVTKGSIAAIDWANGPYYIKSEIDPNGGINYSVTTTQQLMSVPYALYAESASNTFSGNYEDLSNKPTIPTVPTNISAFTNDAGYLTEATVQEAANIPTKVSAFENDALYITHKDIPAIPSKVSELLNDKGYISSYSETDPSVPAWAKDANKPTYNYNEIKNTPTLFDGDYNRF